MSLLDIADLSDHVQREHMLNAFIAGECLNGVLVTRCKV